MGSMLRLVAAGPMFFFSAWLLMIFIGVVAADLGVRPIGYLTAMVVTVAMWLVLAPAVSAIAGTRRDRQR